MTAMRRGWLHLASGAGVGRVFSVASNLLLSRWLGPMDLGLFNLVTTTVQTSETLVRCGADYALNFELGGQPEATRTERGAHLTRALAQLCSLMTALICVVVGLWVWWGQGLFPISLAASQRLILTGFLLLMIACEGSAAAAWEVLLVSHRTAPLALRQGLFFPLRLFFAAVGSLFGGVLVAMGGWTLIALIQSFWLRRVLGTLWNPLQVWPLLSTHVCQLLRRGLPFYTSNFLASMIFYPLLLKVAAGSGLVEIGYLRVGQILQQLFAFLPSTLVPVLFLKLRGESNFEDQVLVMEKPLRIIWFLLLEVLLLYCIVDKSLIVWFFGAEFLSALLPTRILLITALLESLSQLAVQPVLAAGNTRLYGFWQNAAALLAAVLGWLWIPAAGLAAYLIVRLLYVAVPLIGFGLPVIQKLREPHKILALSFSTIGLLILVLIQIFTDYPLAWMPPVFAITCVVNTIFQLQDLLFIKQVLRRA